MKVLKITKSTPNIILIMMRIIMTTTIVMMIVMMMIMMISGWRQLEVCESRRCHLRVPDGARNGQSLIKGGKKDGDQFIKDCKY